jgi:hypothetical protein
LLLGLGADLLELHEEPLEIVGLDAGAVVLDLEAEAVGPLGHDPDLDLAALGGELERVREEVVEDLLEARRIEDDLAHRGIERGVDADAARGRGGLHDGEQLVHRGLDLERLGAELELAGLDL